MRETVTQTVTQTVAPKPKPPKYTFYFVSHGGPGHPFWTVVIKGMEDAAKRYNVKAVYYGPEVFSIEEMLDMLETAIEAKPDGLACTITVPEAVDKPLRKAIDEGIPVVAINVGDPRPPEERIPYLVYIGQDQYLVGVFSARRLLKEFTPRRTMVLQYEPGHVGLETRAKGFIDVMKEKGIPVEKVESAPDPARIMEDFKSYIAAHPDTDAIFCVGTMPTMTAITFLKETGLKGKVRFVGADVNPDILRGVMEGYLISTCDQQQYLQGYLGVVSLYLYNERGYTPVEQVLTGPLVVDKSNVERIARMRYPEIFG